MHKFITDQSGATAIEYAMICATIVLVMLVGLIVLGGSVSSSYNNTAGQVSNAMNPS